MPKHTHKLIRSVTKIVINTATKTATKTAIKCRFDHLASMLFTSLANWVNLGGRQV